MDVDDAQVRATAARTEGGERSSCRYVVGAETYTAKGEQTKTEVPLSMEAVITRSNLMLAYQRVVENKGAAGVDNLSVGELKGWLKQHWAGFIAREPCPAGDTPGRNPQARWRSTDTGYPDGSRQTDPASYPTTSHA